MPLVKMCPHYVGLLSTTREGPVKHVTDSGDSFLTIRKRACLRRRLTFVTITSNVMADSYASALQDSNPRERDD